MRYMIAWLLGVPISMLVLWFLVVHMLLVTSPRVNRYVLGTNAHICRSYLTAMRTGAVHFLVGHYPSGTRGTVLRIVLTLVLLGTI